MVRLRCVDDRAVRLGEQRRHGGLARGETAREPDEECAAHDAEQSLRSEERAGRLPLRAVLIRMR